MRIRKAALKDLNGIVKVWEDFIRDHDKIVLSKNNKLKQHILRRKDASEIFRKFAKKNITSKEGEIFIAEDGGNLVGYILLLIKENIPVFKIKRIGYISDLYLKKEYRGIRISSKLKDEAIKWFRKKGIRYISIAVNANNLSAHSIYDKWGFFDYQIELRKRV